MKKAEILSFKMVFSSALLTFVLLPTPSLGQDMFVAPEGQNQKPTRTDLDNYIRRHVQFQRAERDNTILFAEPRSRQEQNQEEDKKDKAQEEPKAPRKGSPVKPEEQEPAPSASGNQ